MEKKYTLTDEHRAQLKPWADKWIRNAMSTEAMTEQDREICRKAVIGMYAAAGLTAPRVVFVASPFIAAFATGAACAWWHRRATDQAIDHSTRRAIDQAIDHSTRRAIDQATYQATYQATDLAIDLATRQATDRAIDHSTRQATYQATVQAIDQATDHSTDLAIDLATDRAARRATDHSTDLAIDLATRQATDQAARQTTDRATVMATDRATRQATDRAAYQAADQAAYQATDQAARLATDQAARLVTDQAARRATDHSTDLAIDLATRQATYMATVQDIDQATVQAIDLATDRATRRATVQATDLATDQATDLATVLAIDHSTRQATYMATVLATDLAIDLATDRAARRATVLATDLAIDQAADQAADQATRLDKWVVLSVPTQDALSTSCSNFAYRIKSGGNHWSGYDSFLSFFRHVAKLNIDYTNWDHWEKLSLHSGPRYVHKEFCIISDRPEVLRVDAENRPHCEDGPFCRWRDGSALYAWHGVYVPAKWILDRSAITAETALTWPNIEERRAAAEMLGWSNVLAALSPRTINEDAPHIGTLLEVDLPDAPGSRFLRVRCGTERDFVLSVPAEMRTAIEANAWTYPGLTVDDIKNAEGRT